MHTKTNDNCTRRKAGITLVILCCCVFGFLDVSAYAKTKAKALPETAKLLPPETILLVNIDDFQQLKTQYEKTSLYGLYKDPAMAAFVDNAKAKWRENIQKLDDNNIFKAIFGTELWPQGRAAIAMVDRQGEDSNEPSVVVITQWGEGIGKIKEAVDKMLKKNIEAGGHQKKSEKYRGVSIATTIDETSDTLNHCFIGDTFIVATDIELLKFVIAHIKGVSSPTLAGDGDFNAAMKAVGPVHDIDFYVNIKQVVKTMLAEDSSGKARQQTANLGIDNVSAFGCSAVVGRGAGNSISAKAILKINGAKRGICKILNAETAGFSLPPFIPPSAYSMTVFNLDIKKAYDELYSVLYSLSPGYAAILYALDLPDSPDGQPGLKLKDDVIGYLGSQIIISQSVNKPFSNTSEPTEALVAISINDREAIEKSLSILHSKVLASKDPDARRELLGHTIYILGSSSLPFLRPGLSPMQARPESIAPQTPRLAFTVTNDYLIFASEAAVERAIRALSSDEARSGGAAKWLTSAKQAIPSAVGLAVLEDSAASSEVFWWAAKQKGTDEYSKTQALAGLGPIGIGSLFNFGLLPEFDAVRKYFGLSAFYGTSTPDGFFFELKCINPAEP